MSNVEKMLCELDHIEISTKALRDFIISQPSIPPAGEEPEFAEDTLHKAACDLYDKLKADPNFIMICMDKSPNVVGIIIEAWENLPASTAPAESKPEFWIMTTPEKGKKVLIKDASEAERFKQMDGREVIGFCRCAPKAEMSDAKILESAKKYKSEEEGGTAYIFGASELTKFARAIRGEHG